MRITALNICSTVSALITFAFMVMVRPDPAPTMIETAVITLILHEGLTYTIATAVCIHRSTRKKRYRRTVDDQRQRRIG